MYRSRSMDRLNDHHLLYFWMVAREGSVARAAKKLRLASPP
jgi:DNA-binding transcriptional LysR family regulator